MKNKLIASALFPLFLATVCHGAPGVVPDAHQNAAGTKSKTNAEASNNYVSSVLKSVFLDKGLYAVPGGVFTKLLSSILDSWLTGGDQTAKMLSQIDQKLDDIVDNLKTSLQLSNATIDLVGKFYLENMQSTLQQTLGEFDKDVNAVDSKFAPYTEHKIFGQVTFDNLGQLYTDAAANCSNKQILDALDAKTSSSANKLKGGIVEGAGVDDMFLTFSTNYANTSYGAGSLYEQYMTNKSNYLNAVFSKVQKNSDVMQYINYYNYQNMLYVTHLAKSLQKLYYMQSAQLAYRYACNANIRFNNLSLPSGSGQTSYSSALSALKTKYDGVAQQLGKNLAKYMGALSNTDLYSWVNGQLFNPATPLLKTATFNSNEGDAGNCSITVLKFEHLSGNAGGSKGIASLGYSCATKNDAAGATSDTIAVEIPYASSTGTQIDRFGLSNIGYDAAKGTTEYDINNTSVTSDDIRDIANAKVFASMKENTERWNLLANSSYDYNTTGNDHYDWYPYTVVASEPLVFYTNRYVSGWNSDDSQQTDIMFDPGSTAHSANAISASKNRHFDKYYRVTNEYEVSEHYFGMYRGKVFLLKINSEHNNEDNYANDNPQNNYNDAIKQRIGIGCLSESCTRNDYTASDTNTLLSWTDGSSVLLSNCATPTEGNVSCYNLIGSQAAQ